MNTLILNNIKEVLQKHLPANGQAILFGSQARGDEHEDSDWDILVIVDKESLIQKDYDEYTYPLTTLGWDLGVEINPILYTKKEWDANHFTPFYYNVKNEGIVLV